MNRLNVALSFALVSLAGCVSQSHSSSMGVMKPSPTDPATVMRLQVRNNGQFQDAGMITMTRSTQAFMAWSKMSEVALTPEGRIAGFTSSAIAPTNMAEGETVSLEYAVIDRFGHLLAEKRVPSAQLLEDEAACTLKRRIVNGLIQFYCQNNSCSLPSTCTVTTVIDPETGTARTDCDCYNATGNP